MSLFARHKKLSRSNLVEFVDEAKITRDNLGNKARALARLRSDKIRACQDPSFFNQTILRDDTNTAFQQDVIHRLWFCFVGWCWSRSLHPVILAPYGSGKSNQIAVGFPLWLTGRDPSIEGKIVSNIDDLARNRVAAIKGYVDGELGDGTYNALFPEVKPNPVRGWSNHRIFVQREGGSLDPTWQSYGISTGGAGARSHVNIYDDPVDLDDVISEIIRTRKTMRFHNIWQPRLRKPAGRSVTIGTRYHESDLYGSLMDKDKGNGFVTLVIRVSAEFSDLEVEVLQEPSFFPSLEELLHFRWG